MNRVKANILIVLLLLLWFFLGGSCMAAENPSDLELLGELQGNLTTLSRMHQQSKKDLQIVSNELTISKAALNEANKQLTELRIVTGQQKVSLQSLKTSSENLEKELRHERKVNKRHKTQKIIWTVIGFIGGAAAASK